MSKIVTLTMNPTIDVSANVEQVISDKKLRCSEPRREPGGGGINVSRAISRLGGDSLAVYAAGDITGDMLERLLGQEEIDSYRVHIHEPTRENIAFFEEKSNQQYRFVMPGPSIKETEWQECLRVVKELEPVPDYLVASGSLPPNVPYDFYAKVGEICQRRHCRFIVDTSGEALRKAIDQPVYLLKPNMNELQDIAGIEIEDEKQQEATAKDIIRKYPVEIIVLSLGAAGALLVTKDEIKRLRSPSVPIRSKIGAGDSMVAGMVLSLSQGKPLLQAVGYGIASGAAAVMSPGTELTSREKTEDLIAELSSNATG
jgi:6-phosphofructokinase 2